MSHKRRSTNAERKAKAQHKTEARKRDERRDLYRALEVNLHREWRERDMDDLTPSVYGDEDESAAE